MVHQPPDRLAVVFDDERVVANAGLMLAVTLGQRLGIEALVDEIVDLGDRPGAARPGARCFRSRTRCCWAPTASMIAVCCVPGAPKRCSVIARWRRRRWGRFCARSRLGMSASSIRSSRPRSPERGQRAPVRASERLVIDIDSFVGEVHGDAKQGAGYGYTGQRGYHP